MNKKSTNMKRYSCTLLQLPKAILSICCFLLVGSGSLFAQLTFNAEKLTPGLIFQIYEEERSTYEVVVVLENQADHEAMKEQIERNRLNADQRSAYVISSLKSVAAESQADFLDRVAGLNDVDMQSIETYWVVNAVLMTAGIDAITAMSQWESVRMIEHNDQPELIMPVETEETASVPNGREPGHNVINAPAMWALGYTGYGRKALIIDSGNDPTHHALMTNFWWHNAPIEEAWTGFGDFAEDCGSHGSHVNGTVNGLNRYTNDTIGVAFNAHWQGGPMGFAIGNGCSRPFNQSIRSTFQSFQWAMNPDGDMNTSDDMPDVINCSWTSGQYGCGNASSITILNNVLTAGIAIVWANGNNGPDPGTVCCAQGINATLVNSFTVGATNFNSVIANFSSRGPSPCSQMGGSLAIKPEVSAPGVGIRSSVPGNNYANFSGTSMAAPHVAGAVLLLKEAFPFLDGETILLALYYSAIDKGDEGEDNDYGMGVIDVFAAYEYLIDEGHDPVPPVNADNDVVLVEVMIPDHAYCLNTANPEIVVQNAGIDTVFSLTVSYSFANPESPTGSMLWEGILPPGAITGIQMPVIPNLPAGLHELWTEISDPNGQPDPRHLNNRFKVRFEVLDLVNIEADVTDYFAGAICEGSHVIVEFNMDIDDAGLVQWYDAPVGGNLLGTGAVLVTEPLTESTTVYADLKSVNYAGKPQNLPGQQAFHDENQVGLLFDVFEPLNLKSVVVYAEETGTRLVQLQDAQGNSMGLRTIAVTEIGASRVDVNFFIPPGTGYRLVKFAGKPLGMNFNGNFYPYTIPDVISVRRSVGLEFEAQNNARYYYFYDWEIETMYACGRRAVHIEVGEGVATPIDIQADAQVLELSNGNAQVNFSASAEGIDEFIWDFGNNTTATGQNVTAFYNAPGIFLATASAINNQGCASAASLPITVEESTVSTGSPEDVHSSLYLYPNPAGAELNIALIQQEITVLSKVDILDMTGRIVASHAMDHFSQEPFAINIAGLPAGIYAITLKDVKGNQWSSRFLKI